VGERLKQLIGRLPAHMRSPGFAMVAALAAPALLVLVSLGWQSHSPATALITTAIAMLAVGTCVAAPLTRHQPGGAFFGRITTDSAEASKGP
jgi:hypothetical protein